MELKIEKMIYGGDGLARLPSTDPNHPQGKAVFIPFVLEGERVAANITEEKPGFARGRATQVIEPSAHRVPPACPYFYECGGCQYQHSSYEHQLEIKQAILKENLRRMGKIEWPGAIEVHRSEPWNYRNRTRLKMRTAPEFAIGYHRFGSNALLPVEKCPISSPLLNRAIAAAWEAGRAGKVPDGVREIEFFADHADARLLAEVLCAADIPRAAQKTFADAFRAALPETAGVVFLRQTDTRNALAEANELGALGERALSYEAAGHRFQVSAGAFFQVNRTLVDKMVELATAGAEGHTALDLYAGVGLFSLPLSSKFERVIAVEASPTAHADLRQNAPPHIKCVQATTERYLAESRPKRAPEFVITDPPRGGMCERVTKALGELAPRRITYVSCDPATLARDLRALVESGFRIERIHLLDLFPQTFHIETIVQLAR